VNPTHPARAFLTPTWLTAAGLGFALKAWSWVPIRTLSPRHRGRIQAHLLALDARDRYLRFGYPATDEQVKRYVASLDFARDEIFGIFNRRLRLIAMAHLAYAAPDACGEDARRAEFGVTVLPAARAQGYGGRLVEHAVLHARNRGVDTFFIHALTENTPMLRIARRAGAAVDRSGSESEAVLRLPPDNVLTRFSELVETQAAEFDYRMKEHANRVDRLLEAVAEVKSHLNAKAATATE